MQPHTVHQNDLKRRSAFKNVSGRTVCFPASPRLNILHYNSVDDKQWRKDENTGNAAPLKLDIDYRNRKSNKGDVIKRFFKLEMLNLIKLDDEQNRKLKLENVSVSKLNTLHQRNFDDQEQGQDNNHKIGCNLSSIKNTYLFHRNKWVGFIILITTIRDPCRTVGILNEGYLGVLGRRWRDWRKRVGTGSIRVVLVQLVELERQGLRWVKMGNKK